MFRPPSLLAPQIVPTAASFLAGQPRLLHPSRTCVVTFARIGYANRLSTGNWRCEDSHLARFTALSTAPYSLRSSLLVCSPPRSPLPLRPKMRTQGSRDFYTRA